MGWVEASRYPGSKAKCCSRTSYKCCLCCSWSSARETIDQTSNIVNIAEPEESRADGRLISIRQPHHTVCEACQSWLRSTPSKLSRRPAATRLDSIIPCVNLPLSFASPTITFVFRSSRHSSRSLAICSFSSALVSLVLLLALCVFWPVDADSS
jgi:hypothetical protein